jgi:serine/threonine-protein kinase
MKRTRRWPLLALLGASPAFIAAAPAAAEQYLAIAFSQSSGAYGYYHRAASRDRAEEGALQECGPGCEVVIWARDACAALAVGRGNGYGTFWSTDENGVANGAVAECEKTASGCEFKVMTCAGY